VRTHPSVVFLFTLFYRNTSFGNGASVTLGVLEGTLRFIELVGSLSRASAQAVSTEHDVDINDYSELKSYLYVETDVEKALIESINQSDRKRIIFLCGSSGDGKSVILNRHADACGGRFAFHLDATHSFKPDQNAFEALDAVFDEFSLSEKPLVVGINTGMLFNYSSSGDERHTKIKASILEYLDRKVSEDPCVFLNFEDYPKFEIQNGEFRSPFIESILERVTRCEQSNPIYRAFSAEKSNLPKVTRANFLLLQLPEVRKSVIQVLLKARLQFDQFLTTRAVLDFVHHLLLGPGYLFDNLFVQGYNELVDVLSHFDPCNLRTRDLDQFLIERSLGLENSEFREFENLIEKTLDVKNIEPGSWVRALYLLQDVELELNYHNKFSGNFDQSIFSRYAKIWDLHNSFSGQAEHKSQLRAFYRDEMISSLLRFANRLVPSLTKRDRIHLSNRGRFVVSAPIELSPHFTKIEGSSTENIGVFYAHLRVNGETIPAFTVNIDFLEMLEKIRAGYRPNVHDKNAIALLESVIEQIQSEANKSSSLIVEDGEAAVSIKHHPEDGEFVIGEAT
jgi:DNA phosphorothioation-dependent restriction protein DptF